MKHTLLYVLLATCSLTACMGFDPKDQLADGNYWTSPADYGHFANTFYGYVRSFTAATEYRSD